MTETTQDVLVVGGGMAGLAAAFTLRENGASVTLLEQASEFGEVGAGLQLAPNATRILQRWGLLDEVLAVGVTPDHVAFKDARTGEALLEQNVTDEFAEKYGAPYVVVHRSDLHRVLLERCRAAGVTLVNSVSIDSVVTEGDEAVATASNGSVYRAGVVLAADGLKSKLRGQISDDEPISSGYVAYRGTVPTADLPSEQRVNDVTVFFGPNCHMVQYPLRGGELLNTVAVFRSKSFESGIEQAPGLDELQEAYAGCVPHVQESLKHLWHGIRWPMFDREPLQQWVDGRMLLIGDAAHPMLQYLAQGACQAFEDAAALQELTRGTVFVDGRVDASAWPSVFEAFTEIRQPRTARVQTTARVWGESWHVDGLPRLLRNMLFKASNADVFPLTDWVYGHALEESLDEAHERRRGVSAWA